MLPCKCCNGTKTSIGMGMMEKIPCKACEGSGKEKEIEEGIEKGRKKPIQPTQKFETHSDSVLIPNPHAGNRNNQKPVPVYNQNARQMAPGVNQARPGLANLGIGISPGSAKD
jgi:hypothetical protein